MASNDPTTSPFRYRWLIGAALLISLPIMAWTISKAVEGDKAISIPLPLLSTLRPEPLPLQDFSLTDQYGQPFTLDRLKGKWSFVFFGYTSCPDICPTTLHEMASIADILANKKRDDNIQFVFISVDPDRDSIELLKDYMGYFNPTFIGLTGRQSDIDALTQQLNILTIRNPPDSSGNYQVNHTSSIMLIDPKRRWFASFSPPLNDKRIAEQFALLRDFYRQEN
ncbi:MAG TPA: SCO family protein [Gammaproteobacteria bacterium]|nr:SCO family protein [Gammaproteobacteria bacterium]